MNWRALALLIVALSVYAPFVGDSFAAPVQSCCAAMQGCAGHCNCIPNQTCAVSKPVAPEQQILARATALSPRIEVELFTLAAMDVRTFGNEPSTLAHISESPPVDTSQKPQARLCLWLI